MDVCAFRGYNGRLSFRFALSPSLSLSLFTALLCLRTISHSGSTLHCFAVLCSPRPRHTGSELLVNICALLIGFLSVVSLLFVWFASVVASSFPTPALTIHFYLELIHTQRLL